MDAISNDSQTLAPATPDAGAQTTEPTQAQATGGATPDLAGKSTTELAELLGSLNKGGEPQKQEAEKQPDALAIPDKFKNPDGTPNIQGLLKSYEESSKQMHRLMNADHQNRQLQEQLAAMKAEFEQIKAGGLGKDEAATPEKYTPEELELLQNDPKKFIEMETEKRISGKFNELMKEQELSRNISAAYNKAKTTLPGFAELEPEIEAMADKEFIGRHPESIPFMYYAALGQKAESLVNAAKKASYQEGYEKAKADMKLQVEGGGKDTTPADMNLSPEGLAKLSASDLAKILPHSGDSTTSIHY